MLFSILFTIFLDLDECLGIRLVSKNMSKKSQQALEKKNARLNFISARQHSKQTYINSYYVPLGWLDVGNNEFGETFYFSEYLSRFFLHLRHLQHYFRPERSEGQN